MPDTEMQLTYLGHSTFHLVTPGGQKILLDPWTYGNPRCPEGKKDPGPLDKILVSHAHSDHMGDVIQIAKDTGATVLSNFEIYGWLGTKGIENAMPMGKGGTTPIDGLKITMTHADHTSSITDGDQTLYGGEPAGFVIELENGFKIYDAADTAVFGDMSLIAEIYKPDLVLLPIGDHFTMGPLEAAYACRLLGAKQVIPIHYATFPMLTGTPEAFQSALDALGLPTQVTVLQPGETLI